MVEEGFPLASKVTHLKIRKPANFIHRSGDWVFLKVARQEKAIGNLQIFFSLLKLQDH